MYPLLKLLSGNFSQAKAKALTLAEQELVKRLAGNPIFENIPVADLAQGNWGEALDKVAQAQLQKLLDKYPDLQGLPADKLFPIVNGVIQGDFDQVAQQVGEIALNKGLDIAGKELLKAYPALANTPIGALAVEGLTVSDIQGIADAPLATVNKVANRYVAELWNFSQNPGTALAIDSAAILLTGDVFGRMDIPFAGPTETPITRVLTGGTRNQLFLPEPCTEQSCKHFEIQDVNSSIGGFGNVNGKAWVAGKSQSVPGGKGFLQFVNGGKERTGVPVWSTDAHVKLSLEDIDEGGNGEEATARVVANFQVCVYPPFLGEHCTPHFIVVPTPWKVREGGIMLVFSRTSIPDFISTARDAATKKYESQFEQQVCEASDPVFATPNPPLKAVASARNSFANERDLSNWIMTSIFESSGTQNQVDVAVSIVNRLAAGRYGSSLTDVVFASGQYQPNFGERSRGH